MKKVVVIVAAVLLALPLIAYDFGGSLDVSGGAAVSSSTAISPSSKVTGWVKVPFSGGSFSTEAYYKLNASFRENVDPSFNNTVDLSLFKLTYALPAGSLNAGRYSFSDVTGSVFAMTADGANFLMNAGLLKISAYAGYTGLLNAKTSGVDAPWLYDSSKVYDFGSKYAVFQAGVTAPNFFGGTTFAGEVLGAINLNGGAASGVSDGYSRFYGTVSASGAITTSIYYSGSITGSYLTAADNNAGVFVRGNVIGYLPVMSMSVTGKFAWGSSNFQGISYNPCAGSVFNAGASLTLKPLSSLLCLASADVYCGTAGGFKPSSASWNVLARWQALSDVSAFLSIGQNIPLISGSSSSFSASVGATVSF